MIRRAGKQQKSDVPRCTWRGDGSEQIDRRLTHGPLLNLLKNQKLSRRGRNVFLKYVIVTISDEISIYATKVDKSHENAYIFYRVLFLNTGKNKRQVIIVNQSI